MTFDERERVNALCRRVQVEQDPLRFNELILELDEILENTDQRLSLERRGPSSSHSLSDERR